VAPMNDAPELLPFESNVKFEKLEKQGKIIINVLLDGNRTKKHDLGYMNKVKLFNSTSTIKNSYVIHVFTYK
jgi:hypothetical protein